MPIRMTDDQPEEQFNDDNSGGGGRGGGGGFGGGGGGLLALLPLLLSLFKGKRIFLLILILIGGYFLLGRGSGCGMGGGAITNQIASLATGGFLDPKQFEKANIYESLDDDDSKNPLPESSNLQKFAPAVGDQGKQGSCVAWSSAYAARSILESGRTGQSGDAVKFSPAFLYNQIGLDNCEGSYIIRAMEFMTQRGAVPYDQFPYTDQNCSRQPSQQQMQDASQFKMRGFNRLSLGDRNDVIDLRAVKENLSQGAPVVIGMMVGESYMQDMKGKDLWTPAPGDQQMNGFGGHAQCVVGYDDKKYGGSFLIMNSWGPEWGSNGFAWVRYGDFKYFVREAYGLEPMQKVGAAANEPLTCEVGLVEVQYDNNQKRTIARGYIPLKLNGGNTFETVSPLKRAGTRFKMEVKNSTECYVYVFGKETDGTSYTLFPYPRKDDPTKTKYSPFCGIAGYRLFPKDKSMQPDSIGTKDIMAVVVSKKELNWNQLNASIAQNPSQDYGARLSKALGSALVQNIRFQSSSKGNIAFSVPATDNQVVACVVEIDKQ
ncbi:C1 family peptidase [Chitinophagaceae bacterium 26-R-25]|nr:C1 family peptidase [Chitinophagaceae bacterium 26-R-25]